jgi:hypothetical protein
MPKSESASPPSKTVKATVPAEDENFVIPLPFDVRAVFGKARPPIIIKVGEYSFPWTVSVYGGKSFVGIRRSHREAAGLRPGQRVAITITADTSTRTVEVPPDLARALRADKAARAAWETLSFTHRREHVEALLGAKKPETRARRLEKTLEMLAAKKPKK